MKRPTLEVADILRSQGATFVDRNRAWLSYQQTSVLRAIERCRTAALGGHLDTCTQCGYSTISFNSCLMGSNFFWGVERQNRYRFGPFDRMGGWRLTISSGLLLL
jgi:hypothetical protein